MFWSQGTVFRLLQSETHSSCAVTYLDIRRGSGGVASQVNRMQPPIIHYNRVCTTTMFGRLCKIYQLTYARHTITHTSWTTHDYVWVAMLPSGGGLKVWRHRLIVHDHPSSIIPLLYAKPVVTWNWKSHQSRRPASETMIIVLAGISLKPVKCVQGPIVYVSSYSWHSTQ